MKQSYPDFRIFAVLLGVFALVALSGLATQAMAAKGDLKSVGSKKNSKILEITLGKAELIDVGHDLSDVLIANPALIEVMAVQSSRLYIVGQQVGDTNIIALDDAGNVVKRLDVHVTYDLMAIQNKVEQLFPGENVKVDSVHDQIILTGTASSAEQASKIANLVGHYVSDLQDEEGAIDELISNLVETRGEQQVMLQVKIVEATRGVLRELGIETNVNDPNELATTTIFGATQSGSLSSGTDSFALGSAISPSQTPAAVGRIIGDTGISGIGQIGLFLEALEDESLANILAEPNLTAVSGQEAGFLAGGEFPVPVGRDNVGNIVVEFREFGVSLNFRPVVMSDDLISLQMNTEVSSLDFENAVVLADLTVPGLDIRRAETTVEMPSGASLMIAGLLQSEAVKGMTGLPGVSKTPVLGDLVSSNSFQRNESELIVIVTPFLVNPYADQNLVEKAPEPPPRDSGALADAFAANIRQRFDADESLFAGDDGFGYILD